MEVRETKMLDRTNLNIGCGKVIRAGWVNCDHIEAPNIDVVMDAGKPFPFGDCSVDAILLSHVLEHIFDWPETILECHRVLKVGGHMTVKVPYGGGPHNTNPHHVRFFWPSTFDIFTSDSTVTDALDPYATDQMFAVDSIKIRRVFWFGWHLKRYLGIGYLFGRRYDFPFGRKAEIIWVLRKC